MAATYEGSSGPEGASVGPTVTSGNHARPCSVSLVKQDRSGRTFNMTSAFVDLKAREGISDARIQAFPHFLGMRASAPVKSLNVGSLARLTFAPLISYSADAVC